MKNCILLLLSIFLLSISIKAQTFENFIDQLNTANPNERQVIVDSFMNVNEIFPFTEFDTLAHFIYQGNANSVTIAGDATFWNPNVLTMTNITGTDFWYHSTIYESDARLDYKFVINENNWILDPLNPDHCIGGYGPNSELSMPEYLPAPEIEFYNNIPHGTIHDTSFYSSNLNNSRTVQIYLPPDYSSKKEKN